ncbi:MULTISPECIES: DUF1850 domain-containing protein [Halobacillus]|uniref:DUF1850 domain-containing protein n=1 Tax=Halobacillus TaxID=45667 RepID=UPI00068510EF|nr:MULTISPECIES: DUF1850 domain-containing protein [Halobacillus]
MRIFYVFLIGLSAVSLFSAFYSLEALTLIKEGKITALYLTDSEQEFRIRWNHSVEKEDWEEIFIVQDGGITLTGTRFKTFGAGVPHDTGDDTYVEDGWVYMTGIHQPIGSELVVRTGEATEHRLFYGKDITYQLDEKKAYRVVVRRMTVWRYVVLKAQGWKGEE